MSVSGASGPGARMADEDVTAERARLEALAWGAGVEPAVAARARLALRARDGVEPVVQETHEPPQQQQEQDLPEPPQQEPQPTTAGPGADPTPAGDARPATGTGAVRDGGGEGLPAGPSTWRTRASGLLWTARPRVWIALGAAVVVGLAFAAGTLVGTSDGERVAAPSTTPTPGAITLEELLDVPQTYADQLPGPVEAPVSLRTTRLVFTNRALDGSAFETPWNVWAGVGTDRETICLVATANRLESTTACYPREDALHGNVSLSAQSASGTLTITLRGGGVQGTVTNEN
ncbi:hypothetical protein L2091_05120 [Curtobacterium albidum]|uniref:hypothetical protein n=1 Tax=Curtobacterium citreum TaxID=2036 RepID=UPI0020275F65|nr:hypothetical protein [Curtobacterium albidum]MCL9664606.1 hypothetical protein [Curtobacterium albidum]